MTIAMGPRARRRLAQLQWQVATDSVPLLPAHFRDLQARPSAGGDGDGMSDAKLESDWPSVAIVGVGQLGAAVASNLLRNGVELTLFDLQGAANVPPPLRGSLEGMRRKGGCFL